MDKDLLVIVLAFVATVVCIGVFGKGCEAEKRKVQIECMRLHPPLECKAAIR